MQTSLPDPTAPNVGGVPQSHNFFHPHFSNHANVRPRSDTFNIGVNALASIARRITPRSIGRFDRCRIATLLFDSRLLRLRGVELAGSRGISRPVLRTALRVTSPGSSPPPDALIFFSNHS